ncbi:type IV toxin-antitoxin system AbiEi family antitoxin [Glaciihabitans sp. UYNi722]|uniref:type IV toxin-antitoxin system AbiEi family antitoxin n=1 Tax=Glaciihabitans sp. UYNi722 TaxID=3156344 RepID=UPI00339761F0
MPQRLPPVLSRFDLPEAELHAARLDGELYAVDDCFSPIDEIDRRATRAAALSALFPTRLIAEQRTAAWVLGVLARPPVKHQFCADVSARARPMGTARFSLREVVLDESDLLDYSGLRVTTPLRTVVDLARFSPAFGEQEVRMTNALMRLGRFGVGECVAMLDRRRNLPGKRQALARIMAADDYSQPPDTLYTS